ncbi:MAG: hypothetical protein ABJA02_15145 [Acidobacteriota bacterium]
MNTNLLFTLFILVVLQISVCAQTLRWPEMRGKKIQTFDWNCAQTGMYPKHALKRVIEKAIPLEYRERSGTWGDRAVELKLTSKTNVYFVPLVCGTGGCSWHLYSLKPTRYLGEISGEHFYTYRSLKGLPTIIAYGHMSVAEGVLTTYRFRSGKYRQSGVEYSIDNHGATESEFFPGRKVEPMPKALEKAHILCKAYGV